MEKRKLNEFVTFIPGINTTRAQNQFETQELHYYDHKSFEADYNHKDVSIDEELKALNPKNAALSEDDVVISNSLQLTTMVSKNNEGKVLSLNFTKVEFDNDQLDKKYFLYLFNANNGVKRQKEKGLQGTGPVRRITLYDLGEIIIPIPPIEEQRKIGSIYAESIKLQSKLNTYAELIDQFTSSILEESLKGE